MASSVTAEMVREIMADTSLTDAQITPYITSANRFLANALSGKGLDDDTLLEIERWTAAHMIALTRERMTVREEAGSAKVEYAGQWGKSFDATPYGQMAMSLDTSGTLADLSVKKARAYIKAIES